MSSARSSAIGFVNLGATPSEAVTGEFDPIGLVDNATGKASATVGTPIISCRRSTGPADRSGRIALLARPVRPDRKQSDPLGDPASPPQQRAGDQDTSDLRIGEGTTEAYDHFRREAVGSLR